VTTNIVVSVASEDDGHFVVLYLAPGSYDVSIKKDGFASTEIKQVVVRVGTISSVQPQLKVGNVSITVNVTTEAPLVDPTQSALSSVVEKRAIESLPLNGRNFTDFVLLTPGATTDGDFGMVGFNGMAGNFNNYMVDGANNNNAFFQQQSAFGGNFSTATVTLANGSSYVVPEFEAIDGILNPNFGTINAIDNSGKSIYHALLVSWRYTGPQFTGGLAYTFSKTIDQGTGYFNQFDQRNQTRPFAIGPAATLCAERGVVSRLASAKELHVRLRRHPC
jgi:hypothetical protein